MSDKLETLMEKHGGYLPIFKGIRRAMIGLEDQCREAEAAMLRMGAPFSPSPIGQPKTERQLEVEQMRSIFEWGLPEDDDTGGEWDLAGMPDF